VSLFNVNPILMFSCVGLFRKKAWTLILKVILIRGIFQMHKVDIFR